MIRTHAAAFAVGALCCVLSACGFESGECASSSPLSDGSSVGVDVSVASKAGENYLGSLDVNGGWYSGPNRTTKRGSGALTNLAVGEYQGLVSRDGDYLMLEVENTSVPLHGPQACD